jgi:hypothetical protein
MRLFTDLLGALTERFTDAGHIKQQVSEEHRGRCTPKGCEEPCRFYVALMVEASEYLEQEMEQQPSQVSLFGEAV